MYQYHFDYSMEKVSIIVSGLDFKVKKLVFLHQETLIESEKRREEIINLQKTIEEQKTIIKNLEEKIKFTKITKTFENQGKDTYQTKLKINELVREIDKCIALINK